MNRSLPDIPKEWIQQARLADESAIEKIYSKTYPKAYTIAYYSLGATNKFKDEAQTITQDSMRKAFEKLDQLKDDDKFAPWMYTILNNSIRDYFRAHKNKDYQTNTFSELDSEDFRDNYIESIADDSVAFSPEANMNTELIAEGLKGCLDKLPDNQRFALMMQMYQQLTTKEIAEQMEVEENTVKSWIRRAKLSIKDMIEELRSQNKSFYTVAPLPFLAWMLDQELKTIPSFNAKAFANGVVMKVKADTIEPQIHKKATTNTEDELVQEAKRNHLKNASSQREVLEKGTYTKKVMFVNEKAAKLMTGGMWKVVAGVAVASLAATGVYEMVHTLKNPEPQQEQISQETSQNQGGQGSKAIKEGNVTYEYADGYHAGAYVLQADLPIYNSLSKDDPSGQIAYKDILKAFFLNERFYEGSDGSVWAETGKGQFICIRENADDDYLALRDAMYYTLDADDFDFEKFAKACEHYHVEEPKDPFTRYEDDDTVYKGYTMSCQQEYYYY